MPSFRAQSRNPPCTLFFLAPFAEGFQFYFVTHTTLYRCARKIEGFARDDVAEVAFSQHILYTGRGLSIPHTVISSAVEKSSLHSALSCFLRKRFPLFRCLTYGAIPVCQKDPSASLGMTVLEERIGSQGWCAAFLEDGILVSQPSPSRGRCPVGADRVTMA